MTELLRLEVYQREGLSAVELTSDFFKHAALEQNLNDLKVAQAKAYLVELKNGSRPGYQNDLEKVFVDPVFEYSVFDQSGFDQEAKHYLGGSDYVIQVKHRPGVTDNAAMSAQEACRLVGLDSRICTYELLFFQTKAPKDKLEKLAVEYLANNLIQEIEVYSYTDFCRSDRFEHLAFPDVNLEVFANDYELIDFNQSFGDLMEMSQQRCWAFSSDEISFLKDYFLSSEWLDQRTKSGMDPRPTDVEVEVIAQSWSEHCKHKIFGATVEYEEEQSNEGPQTKKLGNQNIKSLYKHFIKRSTFELKENGKKGLISVFSDNAGIVRLQEGIDLCLKVETHNSPSALDPYGGALTGILGVNRDILGCGLGARPVANLDVFCFGPPNWPTASHNDYMPAGLKNPRRILEGVHKGVEDGGNKSGIPTVTGAMHFDQDYSGKPLVFVGTLGVLPQILPSGRSSSEKRTQVGDKIVVIGGAVGADGIHGATFSSLELNETSPLSAVQIGDPLTQKRVLDFIQEARDLELYSGITDNGAGGLSSSLGEMATLTNGASFDLALCPLKYPNLRAFEIMISESQERMSFSVAPDQLPKFLELCHKHNVEACVLGEFNDSGFLDVYFKENLVAKLDLDFLHERLPEMKLSAKWSGPRKRPEWMPLPKKNKVTNLKEALLTLLASPNIASKESWVRQYDHEVQGATHIKPFCGVSGHAPSDGAGIWLYPHGAAQNDLALLGVGLSPKLSLLDPYEMALASVDEAVRNIVVSGADPSTLFLLDNFCWPDPVQSPKNPEGARKMAELVRCCQGLYDICTHYQAPLISGKDSMKNDFRGKNRKGDPLQISILPTLLVTAMARGEVGKTVDPVFKQAGDLVYLLGEGQDALMGSELNEYYEVEAKDFPRCDFQKNFSLYQVYYQAVLSGIISSGHDLSEGGLLVALAESVLDSGFGVRVDTDPSLENLFNESTGRFLVSVSPDKKNTFESHFTDLPYTLVGQVQTTPTLCFPDSQILDVNVVELKQAFMREF